MAAIAQIGYGHWGRNIARNLSELGVLRAVVDLDSRVAEAAASALSVRAAKFEEVLADPAIDAVSLASPAVLHFPQAKDALEAGKHVFVEKPLALDVGEAEALVALARARSRVLMVGHLLQYHPVYIRLRELVAAGELGRLTYVYSNRMSLGKFRAEENVLWSFAPHDISMILGLYGSEPVHVTAQGSVAYTAGIADIATVHMHFADGGSGHAQACWMHPFKEQRLVAIGEHAMAVFDDGEPDWEGKLKIYRHSIDRSGPVPTPVKAEAEAVIVPRGEPLKAECAHFVECIDKGLTPRTDGAEGLSVLKVLQAAELALAANLAHQRPA
jgi:UDP-2-acetamido-3-amino-2,3-dideoxy-glucuronate N-acetyltransferase